MEFNVVQDVDRPRDYASSNLAYPTIYGGMLELADKLHLECSAVRRAGAKPVTATTSIY